MKINKGLWDSLISLLLIVAVLVFGLLTVHFYFASHNIRTYTRAICGNGECQDYYIVCDGSHFVNKTAIGNPVVMTINSSNAPLCPPDSISGTQELALNEQDLQQLGMTQVWNETDCQIQEYSNIVDSSLGQYSICNYTINNLNDTWVVIELQKFANYEALNGSYQYDSLHLFSIQGLISENDYGDQSRFRVNNVNDYGGQYNEPNVYSYHLWICKDLFLIHITSRGSSKDAKEYIPKIGRQILSKFGK